MLRVVAVLALAATAAGFASTARPDGASLEYCHSGPDTFEADVRVRAFARSLGLPELSCDQVPFSTVLTTATNVYGGCSLFRGHCPCSCSTYENSCLQPECTPFVQERCTFSCPEQCQDIACQPRQSPVTIEFLNVNCCKDPCHPANDACGSPTCSSITLCDRPSPPPPPPLDPSSPPASCGFVQPWMEGKKELDSDQARATRKHTHIHTRAHLPRHTHAHSHARHRTHICISQATPAHSWHDIPP